MGNNKKSKSTKTKASAKPIAGPAPQEAPVVAEVGPAKPTILNQPQFTTFCFLAAGAFYVSELNNAWQSRSTCSGYTYLTTWNDDCTDADLYMILAKFHSGLICMALVAFCLALFWKQSALLHRFNFILCSSALITTLVALQTTKSMIHPGFNLKLAITVTVLLILAAYSISTAQDVVLRLPITVDLANATLLTVGVAHAWEAYKFLSAGVNGYLIATAEQTQPGIALLPFLAVDQVTIVGVILFGIGFLQEKQKRVRIIVV